MIATNLSTRPFYNVRAVRAILAVLALIVVVLTALNILQIVSLRASEASLSTQATAALADATRLRDEALQIRSQVDPQELAALAGAARDANAVLERRAFSWTVFLMQLEATLPDGVRVTSIQPMVAPDEVRVTLAVEAQRPEALATFMDALEGDSTFRNVLPSQAQHADDDIIDATIVAVYPPPASSTGGPAPVSARNGGVP